MTARRTGRGSVARAAAQLDGTTLEGRAAWTRAWLAERGRIRESLPAGLSRYERDRRLARDCRIPPAPCYTCGAPPDFVRHNGEPYFEHVHDLMVQAAVRVFGDDIIVPLPSVVSDGVEAGLAPVRAREAAIRKRPRGHAEAAADPPLALIDGPRDPR